MLYNRHAERRTQRNVISANREGRRKRERKGEIQRKKEKEKDRKEREREREKVEGTEF